MSLDFSLTAKSGRVVFDRNITHNLTDMAEAAGIYNVLWRPTENGFIYGRDCVDVLRSGLEKLKNDPPKYEQYNAPNGWGLYEHFVPFVESVLEACEDFETAKVHACV